MSLAVDHDERCGVLGGGQEVTNRIVGWTVVTGLGFAGLGFAVVGWSGIFVGDFEYGGLAVAIVGVVFGSYLLGRSAMVGAVRIRDGVKVRNFDRTHRIGRGATVQKGSYYHGTSAFLFTSPVIVFDDGRELQLTGLKVLAFMDKWTHTTDRNVAKIAAWLRPDDGSTTSSG